MKRNRTINVGAGLIAIAALVQGLQISDAFRLVHSGLIGVAGGILTGVVVVGMIATSANRLPRIASKRARQWGWIFLSSLLVINPLVISPVNYYLMDPGLKAALGTPFAVIVASGMAIIVDFALVLGALIDRSLTGSPATSSEGSKSAERRSTKKRIRSAPAVPCRYAGAGCDRMGSQNAMNAHARSCRFKPTISMPIEIQQKKEGSNGNIRH